MVHLMVLESSRQTAFTLLESLKIVCPMEKVNPNVHQVKPMKEISNLVKSMVTEFTPTQTELFTKVILQTIYDKEQGKLFLRTENILKESLNRMSLSMGHYKNKSG